MNGKIFVCLALIIGLWNPLPVDAQNRDLQEKIFSDLSIDMQWFLSWLNGEKEGDKYNKFTLKRGYVNIKKKINKIFSGRITTDITTDKEGDGEGDIEMRLKYLYLKASIPDFGFFHKPHVEAGLVHLPWIDFEQHINDYRVEGPMFLDINKVVSSADFGLVFMSYFGGEMPDSYKKKVNKSYAGRYGSMALGIFNGGGYHALEKNLNKSIEGRVTIRPLPDLIPGLQITGHGSYGKGNIESSPDWNYGSAFISFESEQLILTGQYYTGEGNYGGSAVINDIEYKSRDQDGYSLFYEWKILCSSFSLFGRYDKFRSHFPDYIESADRYITGAAYRFAGGSKLIIDYDALNYPDEAGRDDSRFEIAIELRY